MNRFASTSRATESLGRIALVIALVTTSSLVSTSAWAGGLYVNEFATSVQANGGNGRGAWVTDASAALHNPASMTRLDDHSIASGFSLLIGQVEFDADSNSPSGTGNGGNQAGLAPIATLNYVHKISDRIRLGFSAFSISGSILDPSNDWAGRFQLTEISLLTLSLTPTVAVRVTDWLSIGGGPVVTYGVLNWDLKADVGGGVEEYVRMDNLDDWQAAGRVGLLLHPSDELGIAVYYQSKTDFNLDGTIDGPVGLTPDLKLDLPLPQFVEVSGYWQATKKVALLATFGWEDWSEADDLSVTLGPVTTGAATGFIDTYKMGIGANYQLTDEWLLQTGVTYDTSALKNKDRTVALPIDQQVRFAFGAQHQWSEALTLGLSFVYVNLGQGEVDKSTVRGDYDKNHAFVFGLTVAYDALPWSSKPYVKDAS